MEKLIISKQLADEVKYYRANIVGGINKMQEDFKQELKELRNKYDFLTTRAVSAYLLAGQERVYEVKKEVWNVVWLTRIEEFVAMTESVSRYKEAEVTISTYDNFEQAQETARELNNSL